MSPIITNQTINPDYLLIYSQLWVVFRFFRFFFVSSFRLPATKMLKKNHRIDLIGSLYIAIFKR